MIFIFFYIIFVIFAPDLCYVSVYFHIIRNYFQFSQLLQILYKILR